MSLDTSPAPGDELQFDRALPATPGTPVDDTRPAVACTSCHTTVETEYYTVHGEQLCAPCKDAVARQLAPVREWPLVLRATLFGFGAAIAGAILYYGVIAITEFEIGIVAIAIGYMVGYAVRKGARGRGGRRLQLAAVALTYVSVAMAYLPLAIGAATDASQQTTSAPADSSDRRAAAADTSGAADAAAPTGSNASVSDDATVLGALAAVGVLLVMSLALPVIVVFGSLPSGLISALIIGIGMRQAWGMTGAPGLTIHGPYRVGAVPPHARSLPSPAAPV